MIRSTQLIKTVGSFALYNKSTFNSVIGPATFFMDESASCGGLTLPFATGIIDDLIVKAKVFGASARQFLVSFLKIFASSRDVLMAALSLLKSHQYACTYLARQL